MEVDKQRQACKNAFIHAASLERLTHKLQQIPVLFILNCLHGKNGELWISWLKLSTTHEKSNWTTVSSPTKSTSPDYSNIAQQLNGNMKPCHIRPWRAIFGEA
jgi:hypothetical protein